MVNLPNIPSKSFRELLKFPTTIAFKVIIKSTDDISEITALIEEISHSRIIRNLGGTPSKKGTYKSWQLEFEIKTPEILDEIYKKVGAHPKVLHIL